jgi:hypothetical protein
MTDNAYTSRTISVQKLIALMNQKVKPIDGLNIPNITVPQHLISKKRATEASDNIVVNTRHLFNSLTKDNIHSIKEQFRAAIVAKAKSVEMLDEIAQEILKNFIISEINIGNYMHLLNAVSPICVLLPGTQDKSGTGKNVSSTIGNFFLQKCKELIFKYISEDNIRSLAKMDLSDPDQEDAYGREREKIINLIITICYLYEQRHVSSTRLSALQLYYLIGNMFTSYNQLQQKMNELGNPYEGDCSDEEEYEIIRKMCNLYAEQLYTFMAREAKEFSKDPDQIKGQTLKTLVGRFKLEIVPTLTEDFLISKCGDIQY